MKPDSEITFIPISFLQHQGAQSLFGPPGPHGFHHGKSMLTRNICCIKMRTRPVCLTPAGNPTALVFCLQQHLKKKKKRKSSSFPNACLLRRKSCLSVFENLIPASYKPEISPEVIPRQREGRNNRTLLFRRRGGRRRGQLSGNYFALWLVTGDWSDYVT